MTFPGENPKKIHQKPYTTLGNFGGSDFGISVGPAWAEAPQQKQHQTATVD